MGKSSEAWQEQQQIEQYRDDNSMWECEFNEWMQAHEQEYADLTAQRVSVGTACKTDSCLSKPF